jgi:hypothetical protein
VIKSQFIGNYFLKSYQKSKQKRTPTVTNLDNAKSVGIIFPAFTEKDFRLAVEYLKIIKEEYGVMNIRALGYFPHKEEMPFLKRSLQVDYFTKKDVNWHFKPESKYVTDFTKEKFDVLIDLSENDLLPLQYVLCMSQAKFKVGRYSNTNLDFYDMMIDVKNKPLAYYIEQLTIYLTNINNKALV